MKKIKLSSVKVNAATIGGNSIENYIKNYVQHHIIGKSFYSASSGSLIDSNPLVVGSIKKQSFNHDNIKIEVYGCEVVVLFWDAEGTFISSTFLIKEKTYITESQTPCTLAVPNGTKYISYSMKKSYIPDYTFRITGY